MSETKSGRTMGDIVGLQTKIIVTATYTNGETDTLAHDATGVRQLAALLDVLGTRTLAIGANLQAQGLPLGPEPECGLPGGSCWYPTDGAGRPKLLN